jgi:ring-1,2-phenylacetyl-CoA epoxidase subunit PaaD
VVTRPPPSKDEVLRVLDGVKDPEVPAVSVVELGIVRDVFIEGQHVTVRITPTYSGCPAMREIEHDIVDALARAGVADVAIETVYTPAWTTDWIDARAREKLRAYGIAPPGPAEQGSLLTLTRRHAPVRCPYCGSGNTERRSEFGSTACKAIHFCNACSQPFDEFKAF